MLLKELNLISFGKFKNQSIILKDGINLIYGENEAGKSTLHSFIDGMFYGFLKPNVKRRDYLPEYEKYNPWDNSRYAGIIRFRYNGKNYRIERIFTKGEEQTRVLEEATGVDITKNIDTGNGRILQPGIHFFGFNTRVFSNTIFIKQLGTKTDDKLANEVTEKLVNVSTALDDNISVDKAVGELKIKMGEIGTDKAPTKPYARNIKDIESLEEEKRNILLEKDSYESYLEEKIRLNQNLEIEIKNLSDLNGRLQRLEILEKARALEEAKILSGEIEILEAKIEVLSCYANLSMSQYEESIKLSNSVKFIDNNIIENKSELENIENRLELMKKSNYGNCDSKKLEEIVKDYNSYEKIEEEKNSILYNKEDNKVEFLKRDYREYKDKGNKYKIMTSLAAIVAIIFLVIGAIAFSLPFFAIGLIFSISYIKTKKVIEETLVKIETVQKIEKEKQDKIKKIEEIQKDLLNKYNIENKIEFKRLLDRLQFESYRKNEEIELYNELKTKEKSLLERIFNDESNKKETLIKLKEILHENNVKDLEDFSLGLDKKHNYKKYITEVEGKREVLRRILGENTLEDLIADIDKNYIELNNEVPYMDKNQLKYEIERVKENISDIKIALKGAEENLNILGKSMERLVVIEEELDRKKKYKEELENKYKSLEMAANVIEELSKDIHSQFAPSINKKVGKIVEKITGGKYNNVRISETLNIGVENPITGEIVDINSLSGGTIDQLYFSLRFGIVNSMVDNRLPLILDDCFTQYDDNRLINIINFLIDIADERQIILFTCHNREREILENLGVEFNLINLT